MGRSSFCVDGDSKTMSVRNCHEFRALAPLSGTHASSPFSRPRSSHR
jgi:hypothetical protein